MKKNTTYKRSKINTPLEGVAALSARGVSAVLLLTILLSMPTTVCAQKLSLSPTSIIAWGVTPVTAKAELSYKDISIIWIGPIRAQTDRYGSVYSGTNTGIFWHPVTKEVGALILTGGAGIFKQPFPNDSHTRINASMKADLHITNTFSITYSHISNAFTGRLNAGVDNLSLTITLN